MTEIKNFERSLKIENRKKKKKEKLLRLYWKSWKNILDFFNRFLFTYIIELLRNYTSYALNVLQNRETLIMLRRS